MASAVDTARDTGTSRDLDDTAKGLPGTETIEALRERDLLVFPVEEGASKRVRTRARHVPLADLLAFTRQLGTMVKAHLTLVQALNALADQTHNQAMLAVIRDIRARIEGGSSLSKALANHPKVFSRLYVAMVAGGERGGLLPEVLTRLTTYLGNTSRLRKKVKSAVMYPILVTAVAILITGFLLTKIVPVFGEVFKTFGASLPAPTRFLIALSELVKHYLPVVLLSATAIIYLILYFIRTPYGRYLWDFCRIRVPVFGDIAHKICLGRFARTFGSLVRSGVPLLEVLQIVSQTVGNVVMEKAVNAVAKGIENGESISTALGKHRVFPNMIVRMVASGEQTGEVDAMLESIADSLDEEIETSLGGLTALIEPILIVVLGVVMGGMVICMFLPIFKLPEIINSRH